MKLFVKYKSLVFLILFLVFTKNVNAQDTTEKLKNLWGKITESTTEILDLSLESFSNFRKGVSEVVDAELELLQQQIFLLPLNITKKYIFTFTSYILLLIIFNQNSSTNCC